MRVGLRAALCQADAGADVRAVVVTGAERDFCVGADLEGGGTVFDAARAADGERAERLSLAAWDVRKPVIAALNGAVAGVGATLPLQWDIRIAGESTRITFVFVQRGLVSQAAHHRVPPAPHGNEPPASPVADGPLHRRSQALRDGPRAALVAGGRFAPNRAGDRPRNRVQTG